MNNLLSLRPILNNDKSNSRGGGPSLRTGKIVTSDHVRALNNQLINLYQFWKSQSVFKGALIGVYYDSIVPKSRRVVNIFKTPGIDVNKSIVGAKFSDERETKHIITYFVTLDILLKTIREIVKVIKIMDKKYNGVISNQNFKNKVNFSRYDMSISAFKQFIVDFSSINKFDFVDNNQDSMNDVIVTFYNINTSIIELLRGIGINTNKHKMIGRNTVLLSKEEIDIVRNEVPYLVSMSLNDLSKLTMDDFERVDDGVATIPSPGSEPVIGVIDTMFDERVYFSEWVEFEKVISDDIPLDQRDYTHGTAVTSIIVDGPSFNPKLDDGCGRFRVKHFGVATSGNNSSFYMTKQIENIVSKNNDIKVWNLSLGSEKEINNNFISVEAAVIDELQNKYDVIFIISGTNKPNNQNEGYKIGAPADSINSLVVNAVNSERLKTKYSRKGIVLSFFQKPDLSYYGGEDPNYINVIEPNGLSRVSGTSFAAPWIARKMSYLIDVLGLSKEVAKALIIDSSVKLKNKYSGDNLAYIGNGVVPTHINDVIKSKRDEIKFYLEGTSKSYNTNFQKLPVPEIDGKHPYKVKGTLCYFPKTNREQGVDYTQTELDLYFGRIDNKNEIKSINRNTQSYEGSYIDEEIARKNFRKWDNVKHIKDYLTNQSIKSYGKDWGMSIKKKHRTSDFEDDLRFGLVITLKAIDGVDRLSQFRNHCVINGIQATEIDIENIVDVHLKAEEEIVFD